jgi:hypothetical protein
VKRGEIGPICGAVFERDIKIALLFPEGKIVPAVDRESKNGKVFSENGRSPVPLMDIAVDDEDARSETHSLDRPRGDGAVVKKTVTLTPEARDR